MFIQVALYDGDDVINELVTKMLFIDIKYGFMQTAI